MIELYKQLETQLEGSGNYFEYFRTLTVFLKYFVEMK